MSVSILEPIECALLTEHEWGQQLRFALNKLYPSIDLKKAKLENFGHQWFENVSPNKSMMKAARLLKKSGRKIGILTNNVVEWEPYWQSIVDMDVAFDIIIDSSKEYCRKPDPRIFQIACDRAGIEPSQCLLIDDVEENILAAKNNGWQTILFTTNSEVIPAIARQTGLN